MQELNMLEVDEVSGGIAAFGILLIAMAIAYLSGGTVDGDNSGSKVTLPPIKFDAEG